jgi:hypothetical protein
MLKEVSARYVMEKLDTELVELVPASEESEKEYERMDSPDDWSLRLKLKIIESNVLKRIEDDFSNKERNTHKNKQKQTDSILNANRS